MSCFPSLNSFYVGLDGNTPHGLELEAVALADPKWVAREMAAAPHFVVSGRPEWLAELHRVKLG